MKKWAILVLGLIGLASIAATCRVINISMTELDGNAVFGGELTNETGANFTQYRVRVAFVEDGDVVDEQHVEGCPRSFTAGNSSFFAATSNDVDDVDDAAALAALDINSTLKAGDPADTNMELTNLDVTRNDEVLRVTGRIDGDSQDDLEDVRVCIVVWDEDGNVVQVARDNNLLDIDEDGNATFSVDAAVPDDVELVDNVSVYVDGFIGNDLTEAVADEENTVDVCPAATATPTSTATSTPTNTPTTGPSATPTPDDAC